MSRLANTDILLITYLVYKMAGTTTASTRDTSEHALRRKCCKRNLNGRRAMYFLGPLQSLQYARQANEAREICRHSPYLAAGAQLSRGTAGLAVAATRERERECIPLPVCIDLPLSVFSVECEATWLGWWWLDLYGVLVHASSMESSPSKHGGSAWCMTRATEAD